MTSLKYVAMSESTHAALSSSGAICPVIRLLTYGTCPCDYSLTNTSSSTRIESKFDALRADACAMLSAFTQTSSGRSALQRHLEFSVTCTLHKTAKISLLDILGVFATGNSPRLVTESSEILEHLSMDDKWHKDMIDHRMFWILCTWLDSTSQDSTAIRSLAAWIFKRMTDVSSSADSILITDQPLLIKMSSLLTPEWYVDVI